MNNIFLENIKNLRMYLEISVEKMSEFLKINKDLYLKIEKGNENLSSDMMNKLSCIFGISLDKLQNERMDLSNLKINSKFDKLNVDDLEMIASVNKIALNADYMYTLLKDEGIND